MLQHFSLSLQSFQLSFLHPGDNEIVILMHMVLFCVLIGRKV